MWVGSWLADRADKRHDFRPGGCQPKEEKVITGEAELTFAQHREEIIPSGLGLKMKKHHQDAFPVEARAAASPQTQCWKRPGQDPLPLPTLTSLQEIVENAAVWCKGEKWIFLEMGKAPPTRAEHTSNLEDGSVGLSSVSSFYNCF